jgi:hypothetical protein
MTLSALTWKQLPTQTLATSHTLPNILDAIYNAFGSSTYADGTTRTLNAGVAWTFSRYQLSNATEAVHGSPPTNTLNQKVIIAGSTGSYTPVMLAGATYATSTLFAGLAKNAGNFATWNGAAPFTSGQFTGYAAFHLKQASYGLTIRCYESQDGIMVLIWYTGLSSAACGGFAAGGIVDPESGDTVSDAESDGKLYALCVSGTLTRAIGNHADNGGGGLSPGMFANSANASNNTVPRCIIFQPGTSSLFGLHKMSQPTLASTFYVQTRSGKYTKIPLLLLVCGVQSFTWNTLTTFGGRLREIWLFNGVGGTTLRNSGVDSGYIVSDSLVSAGNAYLLST